MQTAAPAVSLAVENLSCRRGDRVLFAGLSWRAAAGSAVRIGGPNGAGKTSLLRLLAGFGWPETGEVHREGSVAWLGHNDGLKADLSPRENLEFHAALIGADRHAVASAIERVGLGAVAELPCRLLSAGQRRRAAIARLCLESAQIWLLDEPLTALDVDAQGIVASLVDDHGARGGIAVFTSHQPLASRVPMTEVALV